MVDDQRVYTDEEFALILRQAAELASRTEQPGPSSTGLTLAEMKAAAAQVGVDPALLERAARLLAAKVTASPLEQLTGGPLRHDHEARFPMTIDEQGAARILSAVRVSAGQAGNQDVGHSGSMGMTWHDGGATEALSVTARPEGDGTSVSVVLDRRGTLTTLAAVSGMGVVFALIASGMLYSVDPSLGVGASIVGVGGILATARGYWASSTRKVRERINEVVDVIGQTLAQPEAKPNGLGMVGDGAVAREPDARIVGDAELTET